MRPAGGGDDDDDDADVTVGTFSHHMMASWSKRHQYRVPGAGGEVVIVSQAAKGWRRGAAGRLVEFGRGKGGAAPGVAAATGGSALLALVSAPALALALVPL